MTTPEAATPIVATRTADGVHHADWRLADNGAAIFTWANGQAMRATTVMPDENDEPSLVRLIPQTKTGRDYKGHYGVWLPISNLPEGFTQRLIAALA